MAGKDTRAQFRTRWYHRKPAFWFRKDRARPAGHREAPEVVRFDPEPGVVPSAKPPVRIFLGTEPLQARAERVFIWSVKAHRDPARAYEIYLMKDLAGFDRTGWTTGFTNYRYAIPHLAGEQGRAIYNDVDQIYLGDPAELFDLDMGGVGILCVNEGETSVSLIDCAKMASHWRRADAERGHKRPHFLKIIADEKLWGQLPPEWNVLDGDLATETAKCYHFTTLRTQPWKPFDDQLHYAEHPHADVWRKLEQDANAARFNAFTRERPSPYFAASLERLKTLAATPLKSDVREHAAQIGKLATAAGAEIVRDYAARFEDDAIAAAGVVLTRRDEDEAPFAQPISGRYDGVVAVDVVSALAEEDVPWALDELLNAAERFFYISVPTDAASLEESAQALPGKWWRLQLDLAKARNPGGHTQLTTRERNGEFRKYHIDSRRAEAA